MKERMMSQSKKIFYSFIIFFSLCNISYGSSFADIASGIAAGSSIIGNIQSEKTNRHLTEMQYQQEQQNRANRAAAQRRNAQAQANAKAAERKAEIAAKNAQEAKDNEIAEGQLFSCESRMKRLKKQYVLLAPDSLDTFDDYTFRINTLTSAKAKVMTCQQFLADAEADLDAAAARFKINQIDKNQNKTLDYNHEENMKKLDVAAWKTMSDNDIKLKLLDNDLIKSRIAAYVAVISSENSTKQAIEVSKFQVEIAKNTEVLNIIKSIISQSGSKNLSLEDIINNPQMKDVMIHIVKDSVNK